MAEEGRDHEYEFKIYNSMTKTKEKFKPIVPGKVSMYVCGVTSYDFSHIGHARAYVAFDVLFRYLKHLGYDVKYVRNVTDIDDKIIKRANELGEDQLSLSNRFYQEFVTDMADLQCLPPTEQPRVSDHITQIINMIQKIITNDWAYVADGDVYFSLDNFPNYGRLSGGKPKGPSNPKKKKEAYFALWKIINNIWAYAVDNFRRLSGRKCEENINPIKRNQNDFALWKAAKQGEKSWDSPWGQERPGWHIECSAMSATYLTESFDIHCGGRDLIFPHHENEIAQNYAACPHSKISYWMHNGFVNVNNEKMSKSTGNFFTIRKVTKLYHPLALRHFLLGTHYRSPVNYSIDQIEISSNSVYYIYQTLEDVESAISEFRQVSQTSGKKYAITVDARKCIRNLRSHFEEKLADVLHTTSILNIALQDALGLMNTILNQLKKKLQKPQKLSSIESLIELEKEVKDVLDVLGLLSSSAYTEVLEELKEKALKRAMVTEEEILQRIEKRGLLRNAKEFELADEISKDLTYKGIALMDIGNQTIWRPCVPVKPPKHDVLTWKAGMAFSVSAVAIGVLVRYWLKSRN